MDQTMILQKLIENIFFYAATLVYFAFELRKVEAIIFIIVIRIYTLLFDLFLLLLFRYVFKLY